jgi:hypothetical protein
LKESVRLKSERKKDEDEKNKDDEMRLEVKIRNDLE